jgi:predicted PurR-regulated permease PerM
MGDGMGLSPLVVLMSLVFWGWVLGSVGMVLAVPLTVILRIMLDRQPSTQWVAILLGPAVPDTLPAHAESHDESGNENEVETA